jgi:hypothetical protein
MSNKNITLKRGGSISSSQTLFSFDSLQPGTSYLECVDTTNDNDIHRGQVGLLTDKDSFNLQLSAVPYYSKNVVITENDNINPFVKYTVKNIELCKMKVDEIINELLYKEIRGGSTKALGRGIGSIIGATTTGTAALSYGSTIGIEQHYSLEKEYIRVLKIPQKH